MPPESKLFELLKQFSYREGDFILSSGKRSCYYLDGRMTTLHAEGSRLIGEILTRRLLDAHIDAVGGLTMGADPIVSAITTTSAQWGKPIDGFLIRKAAKGHGTGRQIEGHLQPWYRVALVEDVMTTGGSFVQAIDAIHAIDPSIQIAKLLVLVDREDGGSAMLSQRYPDLPAVEALYSIRQFGPPAPDAIGHPIAPVSSGAR